MARAPTVEAATHASAAEGEALATLTHALCAPHKAVIQQAALRSFVQQVRAWAVAWDGQERPEAALTELSHCIEEPPLRALALATVEDLTGAWSRSYARCAEAVPLAPPLVAAELWRCQATAAVHEGRLNQGSEALKAGLAIDSGNPELHLALAQVQLAQNLPHSAHSTLMALLALDGGTDAALLGRARRMVDEAKKLAAPPLTALDLVEQADLTALMESSSNDADDVAHVRELAQHSEQPQLWSACALVLLRGPDPALGRELLSRAERALPLDADPSRLMAVYHLSMADYPAALTALLRAVRKQPFDPESQIMLASVASRLNHWELTHSAYKALVQLEPDRESHRAGLMEARQERLNRDKKK